MCGWIGNGILARAPIRPNSAWKALGVIGPSRSVMKTCEDAPPRRCLSARLAQRCGSPNPLRTAPGSETARATTSRTDLCVASSTREARQSAINWSRSNIVLIRQCVWTAEFCPWRTLPCPVMSRPSEFLQPLAQGRNACFACLTGPLARPGVLWHLSKVLCLNPRRTTHKPVAGGNRPPGICPRRANVWRGWSRRAAPTNGPAVAEQSSTPAAVQPRPQLSCPASRGSRPADDAVQLQKAFRLLLPLFELPHRANRGQPQAGRGSRGQMRDGQDTRCGGSVQRCPRPPP